MEYAILNGNLINKEDAKVSVIDKAFFFDFAVYESLKVIQGKIFFANYHAKRLLESAKMIGMGHGYSSEEIVDWLELLIEKNELEEASIKIVLIGDAENNAEPKMFIMPITGVTYYPKKSYKKGAKVITYHGERRYPRAKTKDLLMSFVAHREAKEKGAVEALLIDRDGFVREGSRSNFYAVKDNIIYMPPKEKDLGGITKKIILKVTKNDFKHREKDIRLENLENYDELFLSSTLFNVLPIGQIDEKEINSSFEKVRKIQKLFRSYYQKNILEK